MSDEMPLQVDQIGPLIRTIRGQKVILDYDWRAFLVFPPIVSMRPSNAIATVFQTIFCFNSHWKSSNL